MLNTLAKNQFVKMSSICDDKIEYGLVLSANDEINNYEILSIGTLNKNGEFLCYPTNVENITESINIKDRVFEEVKDTKIRRKMNKYLQVNYNDLIKH